MDLERVKQLRRSLTLHFAIIAWLTAMLVATGSGSIFLPAFIFLVSVAAFVFVDWLEWFELGRIGSYIGMLTATSVAIAGYIYSAFNESEAGQLLSVAGLLVYPEAVLFLQRKNLRIFEQLAVFLLLEMIVAALVNDNILFGVLLAPIMLLWVSSLFLFSRYATIIHSDPTLETPTPKLAEVLFRRFMKSVIGENERAPAVTSRIMMSEEVQKSRTMRRGIQSTPIGIGALLFACLFFYLLPRTSPGNFPAGFREARSVGLPNSLRFGRVGRILQNPTPVMRVSLKDAITGENFPFKSQPYLRAAIFDSYNQMSDRLGVRQGEWIFSGASRYRALKPGRQPLQSPHPDAKRVRVEFDIKLKRVSNVFTVPPVFMVAEKQRIPIEYDRFNNVMRKLGENDIPGMKSLTYSIGSVGFTEREQIPVTEAFLPVEDSNQFRSSMQLIALLRGFHNYPYLASMKDDWLNQNNVNLTDPVAVARSIQSLYRDSGRFTYSLDLRPPTDPELDAVEDFVVNSRQGHCQYYATAMVGMLRQSGIPSRVVVGYHPKEFNKLGQYFLVRQSDAHAWVEALFSHDQLVGTEYESWLTDADFFWVRFDPTPGAYGEDDGIIEQEGQAMDFAEKLWEDYVIEGEKLSGQNSLYAPVSEGSDGTYAGLIARLKSIGASLQDGSIWNQNFSVLGPFIGAIVLAVLLLFSLWRLWFLLPRFAPRWALRLGLVDSEMEINYRFYAQALRLLERLGMRREQSETPQEFTREAAKVLAKHGETSSNSLQFLTDLYYRLRFGNQEQPTAEEAEEIDAELQRIDESTRIVAKT